MNKNLRRVSALLVSVALAWGTGCGGKPDMTSETKQPGPDPNTRPQPVTKDSVSKRPVAKTIAPGTKVSAEELAREFKTDSAAATATYTGKTILIEGKLKDIKVVGKDTQLILDGQQGEEGPHPMMTMKGYLKTSPFNHSRGQQLRVEGTYSGTTAGAVSFTDSSIRGADTDSTPKTSASSLLGDYKTDAVGDAKYKGKILRVENAEVESLPQDGTLITIPFGRIPTGKPLAKKIRVEYSPSYKPLFPQLKKGGLTTIYGRCEGASGSEIVIKDAWFLPYIPVP